MELRPVVRVFDGRGRLRVLGPALGLALAATLAAAPFQSGLTADERRIAAAVDAHNDAALALLERAVNINSGTENLAGVRAVGKLFQAEFDALGFHTHMTNEDAVARAGQLVAEHPGPGPRILLIGHLDTVFPKDSPFQTFERLDAKTAKGPGVIDMKGGDVIILSALRALDDVGLLPSMNIVVVMMGDEEDAGRPLAKARAALFSAAQGAEDAIGFEDGDGDPTHAIVARRGSTNWVVQVTGTPAHSSQIFTAPFGDGAIFEAARLLNAFREKLSAEPHLTFNPGAIVGGTTADLDVEQSRGTAFGKDNVIAEHATVTGDLRALTPEQYAHAEATMKEIVAASLPKTHATIAFDDGYPPLAPTDGNTALLAEYDRASRDLGFGPVTAVSPDKAGAADVSFVAGIAKRIIDAAGLKGHDDHTTGETADLSTLPMQTKRAAILLARLSHGK